MISINLYELFDDVTCYRYDFLNVYCLLNSKRNRLSNRFSKKVPSIIYLFTIIVFDIRLYGMKILLLSCSVASWIMQVTPGRCSWTWSQTVKDKCLLLLWNVIQHHFMTYRTFWLLWLRSEDRGPSGRLDIGYLSDR